MSLVDWILDFLLLAPIVGLTAIHAAADPGIHGVVSTIVPVLAGYVLGRRHMLYHTIQIQQDALDTVRRYKDRLEALERRLNNEQKPK